MSWFDAFRFRARGLRRGSLEDEFDDEVNFHLDAARGRVRSARPEPGGRAWRCTARLRHCGNSQRGSARRAWRAPDRRVRSGRPPRDAPTPAATPGFAAAALLTIALGIGATTAVFTVVYNVILRPLPYPEPERLVTLWSTAPALGLPRAFVGAANYRDWVVAQPVLREPCARTAHRQFQPDWRRRAGAIAGRAGYRQPVHCSGNKPGR